MRENLPFAAAVPDALPAAVPTARAATVAAPGGCTAAILPHRAAYVAPAWRSARVWVGVAFPTDLDAALTELKAAYPALAENIARLEHVAQQEASTYQNEPNATPGAFQAALRAWERAVLDALAALEHVQHGDGPRHQLELEVSHD